MRNLNLTQRKIKTAERPKERWRAQHARKHHHHQYSEQEMAIINARGVGNSN